MLLILFRISIFPAIFLWTFLGNRSNLIYAPHVWHKCVIAEVSAYITARREQRFRHFWAWDWEETAELSSHHQLDADACHCSRFWVRAESLRYQSAHACTSFPLVEADIKMLTRSMRFSHDPPAGNSGRGEVDDGWWRSRAGCEEEGNQERLQSPHFVGLGSCERGKSDEAPPAR